MATMNDDNPCGISNAEEKCRHSQSNERLDLVLRSLHHLQMTRWYLCRAIGEPEGGLYGRIYPCIHGR